MKNPRETGLRKCREKLVTDVIRLKAHSRYLVIIHTIFLKVNRQYILRHDLRSAFRGELSVGHCSFCRVEFLLKVLGVYLRLL
jgi:hypothetical protein